jgi:hypothetical protein
MPWGEVSGNPREHGGSLPGWIVGTAGAIRYSLPTESSKATFARTHVYGYLLATVSARGIRDQDPVELAFQELTEAYVPADVRQRFGSDFVRECFQTAHRGDLLAARKST